MKAIAADAGVSVRTLRRSATVTLIAVGVLAGAALLGALLPARAAARLDPADAIARE